MSEDDGPGDGATADEDWFEQALREHGDDSESDESDASGDEGNFFETDASGDEANPFETDDEDTPFGGDADETIGGETDAGFGDATDAGFGGEVESDAGSPFEDTGGFGTEPSDAFASGGKSPFDSDDGGGLFEEDFASAFASAGGGGSEGDFDEESFDSNIPRLDLGIEGLDEMIQGGIPKRSLMVVIGAPGAGKTTFGLQFLHHGLEQGENVVFITLEQSRESILDTAADRDWAFDRYEADEQLAILDLDPVEMANSLENIRDELPTLIQDFGASRLVLDSVSLLEMMYEDRAERRTQIFDFTRSLKRAGVTTFLTSEASEDNPYATRHGIIEYLTDAVFVLQYVRREAQETRLAVEIQKIRNANHSRQTKPYEITADGISVYQQANIF